MDHLSHRRLLGPTYSPKQAMMSKRLAVERLRVSKQYEGHINARADPLHSFQKQVIIADNEVLRFGAKRSTQVHNPDLCVDALVPFVVKNPAN